MHDIVLVISDLSAGGAQRVLVTLANALSRRGKRIFVITMYGLENDFFRLDDGIDRTTLNLAGDSYSLVSAVKSNFLRVLKIRRAIKSSGAPVVLSFVGSTNIITILATLGLGVFTVISERNDPSRQSLGRVWDQLRKYLYSSADLVTANSKGALDTLAEFVPKAKLRYVPNSIKVAGNSGRRPSPETKTVLTVGRLTPQKAQKVLLEAFSSFVQNHSDWRLRIVGDGELENDLKRRTRELEIGQSVEFIAAAAELDPYYETAEIFVLSSLYEGTPNVLLEAMSYGIPSIISDACGGGLEFVEHDVSGLIFRSGDVAALADSLTNLAEDASLRRRLGSAGLERISHNHEDVVVDYWEELLGLSKVEV